MIWLAVVAALAAIGFMGFFPGQAEPLGLYVWPAEETPVAFQEALRQGGWTPSGDRRYYFISYLVGFRSLLPLGLDDLRGRVRTLPDGVRAHLYHQFFRHTTRFESIVLETSFLVELPPHHSPEELARHLDFAIVSGKSPWPQVSVRVPPEIELERSPLFTQ